MFKKRVIWIIILFILLFLSAFALFYNKREDDLQNKNNDEVNEELEINENEIRKLEEETDNKEQETDNKEDEQIENKKEIIKESILEVNNIDKVKPTATIKYSTKELTNKNVRVTLVPSEEIIVTNNNGLLDYEFDKNGTFIFEFKDKAGNVGSAEAIVNNIDKVKPTATIKYSTKELTNKNVKVTLIPSEEVTVINNEGLLNYEFDKNGKFTFEFKDKAGNVGSAEATVNNIDKVKPTATIKYSTKELTNKNVKVTLIPSEEITVTNNEGSLDYEFDKNGIFTFEFKDKAGNVGSAEAIVNNIDKVKPTATIKYSTKELTNKNVKVTLIPSEEVIVINNEGSLDYKFKKNGTFTFEFKDKAGNVGSTEATVNNIDKVKPIATIKYSTKELTNKNVKVTLIPSEEVTVTNNEGSLDYKFKKNGTFMFNFVDKAGNVGSAEAIVNNIDKEKPTATIKYSTKELTNKNVKVTLIPSEEVIVINNSGLFDYEFDKNGTFIFEFKDKAGNVGSAEAIVNNIDKVKPILKITGFNPLFVIGINYDIDEVLRSGVSAYDKVDGDITDKITYKIKKDKFIFKKNYVTYFVTDKAGNTTSIKRTVFALGLIKKYTSLQ